MAEIPSSWGTMEPTEVSIRVAGFPIFRKDQLDALHS